MTWNLRIAHRVERELARLPVRDRQRILVVLQSMRIDPFGGDTSRLIAQRAAWRRRVGAYRIFFDVDIDGRQVDVVEITRRTSTTY